MDSLTQIVLGAACGEAVLGKKIGNKALLFGAIGGTIPDLDVFVGSLLYENEIQAMAFHRGFMHSIVFSVIGAFALGWLVFRYYNKGKRQGGTTLNDWIMLFFLALFTHPILDSFTPYGTQLFSPFWDYRVAFNTIAVIDPLYTLPFLACLIGLMFYKRQNRMRRVWLKCGIVLSSLYLSFTVINKYYVNSVYKRSLLAQGINFTRYQTQPSIFNNILWYGIAETNNAYHVGFYSLFDRTDTIIDWQTIKKQHHLVPMLDEDLATLAWFSDGYFNISNTETEGNFLYSDLRYPLLNPEDSNSSIFSLLIYQKEDRWDMKPFESSFSKDGAFSAAILRMYQRLKGI